jgi:hypothetical protein
VLAGRNSFERARNLKTQMLLDRPMHPTGRSHVSSAMVYTMGRFRTLGRELTGEFLDPDEDLGVSVIPKHDSIAAADLQGTALEAGSVVIDHCLSRIFVAAYLLAGNARRAIGPRGSPEWATLLENNRCRDHAKRAGFRANFGGSADCASGRVAAGAAAFAPPSPVFCVARADGNAAPLLRRTAVCGCRPGRGKLLPGRARIGKHGGS